MFIFKMDYHMLIKKLKRGKVLDTQLTDPRDLIEQQLVYQDKVSKLQTIKDIKI